MTGPQAPEGFAETWHAQAFALTVHLHESGLFDWPLWADTLADVLHQEGAARPLDGSDDYYLAWITALERLCTALDLADPGLLAALKSDWQEAYRSTPHGAPVRLPDHSSTSSIST